MVRLSFSGDGRTSSARTVRNSPANRHRVSPGWSVGWLAVLCLLSALPFQGQVFTVDTSGKGEARPVDEKTHTAPVDRRFAQIVPTHVELPAAPMDAKTRILLLRDLQSEQGFAMRPLPKGHKGLTLRANGALTPAGESYLAMVTNAGLAAKPGSRVVITDVKVEGSSIVLLLNGGPDFKHRFLRHVEIGAGPMMNPVVQDGEADPEGARLTLTFAHRLPAVHAKQVKDLLAPLISFDVKTPVQAFTDTLPKPLRDAILNHEVWVGMTTDMVLFAKGQPRTKSREMDGQMPFEEWIYGMAPEPVEFVRINGNRVIRVEIARVGEKPEISEQDRVYALMRTDGTETVAQGPKIHVQREGDVERDPDRQAPAAPPSLHQPGDPTSEQEKLAAERPGQKNVGVMRPVQDPKPHAPDPAMAPAEQPAASPAQAPASKPPGANPDEEPAPGPAQAPEAERAK